MIQGYEKAWASLIAGLTLPLQTLALFIASIFGAVPAPPAVDIQSAITGLISAMLGAAGAFIATNSEPTNISVPAIVDPNPPLEPK